MLIVLCLCMLVASLGIMQISFLDSSIIHAELDKLAAVCDYLQQRAITTNTEQILTCNLQTNSYDSQIVHEKITHSARFGFLPNAMTMGSNAHSIKKAITFVDNLIHFYPTGIISSGTIYLIDNKKQFMYALSNAVSKVSHLRLYRYDGAWKLLNK